MHFFKAGLFLLVLSVLGACTPEYAQQKSAELAAQTRLTDTIDIQRNNQRLLSRQAQVCLVSDAGGTPAGANLLRAMQAGFNGYFLAVGVENEPMDYLRAVEKSPCPSAFYLFYVQPSGPAACSGGDQTCGYPSNQYTITIVSYGDRLVDRVTVTIKSSFLSGGGDNADRLQKAFSELALALTGMAGG